MIHPPFFLASFSSLHRLLVKATNTGTLRPSSPPPFCIAHLMAVYIYFTSKAIHPALGFRANHRNSSWSHLYTHHHHLEPSILNCTTKKHHQHLYYHTLHHTTHYPDHHSRCFLENAFFTNHPKFINFILLILTYNVASSYRIYTFNQNVTLEHAMHAIFELARHTAINLRMLYWNVCLQSSQVRT